MKLPRAGRARPASAGRSEAAGATVSQSYGVSPGPRRGARPPGVRHELVGRGRLPRAREWQLLAAGPEARLHPWGNRYDPAAAVTADLPEHGPRPRSAPGTRDSSPGGVLDLAGNVSERTRSIAVDRGSYAMWVQGGNWLLPGRETTYGSFARLVPLNHPSPDFGFRVVYD